MGTAGRPHPAHDESSKFCPRHDATSRYLHAAAAVVVLLALVIAGDPLVQWKGPAWSTTAAAQEPSKKPANKGPLVGVSKRPKTVALTANAAEMRDAILAAVKTGDISELKHAIAWNELPPEFGETAGEDPIAFLKAQSVDGEGREILAIIANLLSLEPASLPIGADYENNTVFVWPYLAELPLHKLTPAQDVDLLRLMPAAEAKALRQSKKWTWWRLAIGADGTWLSFMKHK